MIDVKAGMHPASKIGTLFFRTENAMTTKENQDQQIVDTVDFDATDADHAFPAEDQASEEVPSEVGMRINLLGKLIIPPPTP